MGFCFQYIIENVFKLKRKQLSIISKLFFLLLYYFPPGYSNEIECGSGSTALNKFKWFYLLRNLNFYINILLEGCRRSTDRRPVATTGCPRPVRPLLSTTHLHLRRSTGGRHPISGDHRPPIQWWPLPPQRSTFGALPPWLTTALGQGDCQCRLLPIGVHHRWSPLKAASIIIITSSSSIGAPHPMTCATFTPAPQ